MRKVCLQIITCILLLMINCSTSAEIATITLLSDNAAGSIADFCLWNGKYAVLGTEGVFEWLPSTQELTCVMAEKDLPDSIRESLLQVEGNIFAWKGELFLAESSDGSIWSLEDLSAPAYVIPEDDYTYDNPEGIMNKTIRRCIPMGNDAWFLLNSFTFENGDTNELYRLTSDGVFEIFNVPDLKDAFPATDGILLQKDDGNNVTYTLLNNEMQEIPVFCPETEEQIIAGITYDTEDRMFYGVTETGRVYKQDQLYANLPFRMIFEEDKGIIYNNTYIYLHSGTIIIRELTEKAAQQIELRIMGTPDDEDLILKYQATHPDITIVMDPRSDDFIGLQQAAISQDCDVDLFLLDSDDLYKKFINKEYEASLNNSSTLTERSSHFYPWLRQAVYDRDTLAAWPISVDVEYWTVNTTAWEKLKLGDYPVTWQEMLSLLSDWNDSEYAFNHPELCFLESVDGYPGIVNMVIRQYLLEYEKTGQLVDFNTPEFREALQLLMKSGASIEETGGSMPLIMTYPQYLGVGYNDSDVVESCLPPALTAGSERQIRATAQLLVINRSSKHYEEALSFLEFMAEHTDTVMQYKMYENLTSTVRPDDYELEQEQLQEEITSLQELLERTNEDSEEDLEQIQEQIQIREQAYDRNEKEYWIVSPQDLTIWLPISSHVVMPLETVYPNDSSTETQSISSLVDTFCSGETTPDQFISMLNGIASMIYYENQ